MPRQLKNQKPLIHIFCEGESEQVYADFLKEQFGNVAVIKRPKATGLFSKANDDFKKAPKYKNSIDETDEIWFFFDVETKDRTKWNERLTIINQLRNLRKKSKIRVRLLMTTGCIEYWLMLHYKLYTPPLQTVAEKQKVIDDIKKQESTYKKGDKHSTFKIARNYKTAVKHAEHTMKKLLSEGLPTLEDNDDRNKWLCSNCKTFSNVYESIQYLESLT